MTIASPLGWDELSPPPPELDALPLLPRRSQPGAASSIANAATSTAASVVRTRFRNRMGMSLTFWFVDDRDPTMSRRTTPAESRGLPGRNVSLTPKLCKNSDLRGGRGAGQSTRDLHKRTRRAGEPPARGDWTR